MKPAGTSIIFVDDRDRVLLLLRDDRPDIRYPNQWDIPGGGVEPGETPEETIVREMREEIGLELKGAELFERTEFPDRIEYTFWKRANLVIEEIDLMEGQELRWFTREEAAATPLAFGFNPTIEAFFQRLPILHGA
ncbi:NUDIX domain-containing protein [Geomonas sp. Red32]|uniref:NUDIX hydrolase n=1 Tax=Geomonas sp. Red32 TaxID=2912856 RepID=UPI00202CD8C0|nr:NUDIX domain-containing protein [Geomonas sp. Red32]MCM0080879.1 NUDIX domain-containing protein [Geomonas sp. Red32]